LRGLNLRHLLLVGHSMGGAIVQTLALTHPEIVQGIVLAGTGARLKVLPAVLDGIHKNFEETVRRIVQYAFSRKASPELIEKGTEYLLGCRPRVLYGDFLACDRFDFMKEVSKIDLPALILCGAEDELTPVTYSEFLHQHIRLSRLEILAGAGHMVMMESPEAFNREVREFIRGIRS
jgi:pimeloyl-ACP methyl ester carboxylesterase